MKIFGYYVSKVPSIPQPAVEWPEFSMQRLALTDGDVLVLSCTERISAEMRDCLKSSVAAVFPEGKRKVLVLERVMSIGVIGEAA